MSRGGTDAFQKVVRDCDKVSACRASRRPGPPGSLALGALIKFIELRRQTGALPESGHAGESGPVPSADQRVVAARAASP